MNEKISKIGDKLIKSNKLFVLFLCIAGMLISSVFIPLLLDMFFWGNDFPSSIDNSDWSGFLGSFLGGIIGGIGTLIAVSITTLETRAIQEENRKRSIKEANKGKLERIIKSSSAYWRDIDAINRELKRYKDLLVEIEMMKNKSERIENELARLTPSTDSLKNQIGDLTEEQKQLINKLNRYEQDKRVVKTNAKNSIKNAKYHYLTLDVYLRGIDIANDILTDINSINTFFDNLYSCTTNKDLLKCIENNNVEGIIDAFPDSIHNFVNNFENKYINQ